MNVLFLLNLAGQGGTERYIQTLVEKLDGREISASFVCNEPGPLLDWMQARGVPCRQLTMTGPFDFRAAKELAAICRADGIDVIHTHFLREEYIALLAKRMVRGLRVVNTYHILTENGTAIRLCNRLLCPSLDAQIANCTAGRERLIQNGVPAGKIRLIPNAVDLAAFEGADGAAVRRELGIPAEDFMLLFAARFVEGKGHLILLDALRRLRERTARPVWAVLPGVGELLEPVKAAASDLDRVLFPGYRSDMAGFYAAADVTVCPSESETLSLLLLESLASGTPVIASAVGGMLDIVTPEHDCGLSFPVGDAAALADAILRLMEDPALRSRFAAGAKKTARAEYGVDAVAREILKTYQG
ncbi:MAG: glycosyltransferase [Oscillospiraceae bacterium]|nr:glycosyltransferase [Oscillospiraceae bacterium]